MSNQKNNIDLSNIVTCTKHPGKKIEYFCRNLASTDRLFCSTCIFKKDYGRLDLNEDIKDINEYLSEYKDFIRMSGLNERPDIFKFIQRNLQKNESKDILDKEYKKLEKEIADIQDKITQYLDVIKNQYQIRIKQYQNSQQEQINNLLNIVNQNFQQSFFSRFNNINDLLSTYDLSNQDDLIEMLYNMVQDQFFKKISFKEIDQIYENIVGSEQQLPQFDFSKLGDIQKNLDQLFEKCQNINQNSFINSQLTKQNEIPVKGQNTKNQETNVQKEIPVIKFGEIRKISFSSQIDSRNIKNISTVIKLNNNKIATGSDSGEIKIFDLDTNQQEISLQGHQSGIKSLCYIQNGLLASGDNDSSIIIWDISKKKSIEDEKANSNIIQTLAGHVSSVSCLQYLGNNILVSGSADYTLKSWNLQSGLALKTFSGHQNEILCLSGNQGSEIVVTGSTDKNIHVWNINKSYDKGLQKILKGHSGPVHSVFLYQDNQKLASGSADKTIKIWKISTGENYITLIGHISQINKLVLFSDSTILSCSNDGTIKFWDKNLKICIHTLQGHDGNISSFDLLEDRSIVSVGAGLQIITWN